MEPEEFRSVLDRLERLERRDRRMRLERLFMLAAIVGLLASGPALRLLDTAAPALQAGERGVQSAATRSFAGLRHLLRVQPVLDPATVAEDEREAFDPNAAAIPSKPAKVRSLASRNPEPRKVEVWSPESRNPESRNPERGPVKPLSPSVSALAAHQPRRGAASTASVKPKSVIAANTSTPSRPEVSQALNARAASGKRSVPARATTAAMTKLKSKRALARRSTASSNGSLAAAGLLIGRDVQKRLTSLPGDGFSQSLALAEWPDLASDLASGLTAIASPPGTKAPAAEAGSLAILPQGLRGAEVPPVSASAAEPDAPPTAVPQTPVALKALGYAQAEDGSAQIVLSNGNALFVVNEGQEFLDRFRVVSLRPEGVDVEDRLTNSTLHLTFGN